MSSSSSSSSSASTSSHPSSPTCIFCKIIRGEIPSMKVFENEHVLAFLDINPVSRGHTLVVPKAHYEVVGDMPGETLAAALTSAPAICKAVAGESGAAGYNLLQNNGKEAGQEVPHVHFHIIPRFAGDGLPVGKVFAGAKPASQTYTDPKEFAANAGKRIA